MHHRKALLAGCIVLAALFSGGWLFRDYHPIQIRYAGWPEIQVKENPVLFQPAEKKSQVVALTFDDGPKAGVTDWLLDALDERNVKVTFFLIGNQIEGNEAIISRMYTSGHQIGCHTYDHMQLTLLSQQEEWQEISQWYAAVSAVIGDFEYDIRPPYGSVNNSVCENLNKPLILWSVDTEDWTGKTAEEIADYIVAEADDGDIILLHDIFEESVRGAVMALDELQRRGYTFVTVNELLEMRGIAAENGHVYRCAAPK
jgi:peptidoglycan/xylan/chitin deacetylase (PgdA/CDA1 family)